LRARAPNGFGYTPDVGLTPSPVETASTSSNRAQRLAGVSAAAFSSLAAGATLGADQLFALLPALAADLSDGTPDGNKGTTPILIAGTNVSLPADIMARFGKAVEDVSKTVVTPTYRVSYAYPAGTMGAMQGKSTFKVTVTKREGGAPVPGLTIEPKPLMIMGTKDHATPVDAIVDDGDGSYTITLYYLMSTLALGGKAFQGHGVGRVRHAGQGLDLQARLESRAALGRMGCELPDDGSRDARSKSWLSLVILSRARPRRCSSPGYARAARTCSGTSCPPARTGASMPARTLQVHK